jgi:serine/threonine-protein kinase
MDLERKVIVKEINRPDDMARLLDEIRALQIAKSKNVVQIYDVVFSDNGDEAAIVEEFLEGDDLLRYRVDHNNIDEFYMILYQLSHGLMDIHQCGIVHRDFKPNNVKYDSEKILKIFDFGLAKYENLPASTVGAIGTFGFMAPELFCTPPYIDKPVDSYAFGATAFCFAKGKPPDCALNRPIPSTLTESISDYISIDPIVEAIIDKCFQIDHSKRPTLVDINYALKKKLLWGRHRGTLTSRTGVYFLKDVNKGVRVTRDTDQVIIVYDGYDFKLDTIVGDVFVNNSRVSKGFKLDGSSVITLGAETLGPRRTFVTFDVSHPEVVL